MRRIIFLTLTLLVVVFGLVACQSTPTQTPYPTYTPYPTLAPGPASTPTPNALACTSYMSLLYKGITGNSLGKQRKLEAFYEVASGAEELRIRAAANGMLQGLRGGDEKVYEGYEREFITLCSAKGLWSAVGPSSVVDAQANFRDGVWVVGVDIAAGLYRNSDSSGGCYWARLNGFGGTLDDIIANRNSDSIQTVTIASSDAGFLSTRCGTWTKDWMTH